MLGVRPEDLVAATLEPGAVAQVIPREGSYMPALLDA
jgi:hypothetical protein